MISLDIRSIAFFRIVLAFLILYSLPLMLVPSWVPYGMTGLALFLTSGLLLGYWSRFHSFALFILLSVCTLAQGSTEPTSILLRFLFWSTFLPLGASYSMDAALNTEILPQKISPFFSGWTLLLETAFCGGSLWYAWYFHTGFFHENLFLKIGIIGLGLGLLIPSFFWDRLLEKMKTPSRVGLMIYYDGNCRFCKKMTEMIKIFLILPFTPLLPAQSLDVVEEEMRRQNSWVVIDAEGHYHFKFEALVLVLSLSPLVGRVSQILRIDPLMKWGTKGYEWIASHRVLVGKITRWWVYRPIHLRLPGVVRFLLVLFFLFKNWV